MGARDAELPRSVREYLTVKLGALNHEVFGLILADGRHRVIEYVELFRGTIDGASVHPREVVKLAPGSDCPRTTN